MSMFVRDFVFILVLGIGIRVAVPLITQHWPLSSAGQNATNLDVFLDKVQSFIDSMSEALWME